MSKQKKEPNPLHVACVKAHHEWWLKFVDLPYVFDGGDGKAMHTIIKFLRDAIKLKSGKEPFDDEVLASWQLILEKHTSWGFYSGKLFQIKQIASKRVDIVKAMRDGKASIKQPAMSIDEMKELNDIVNR